VRKLRGGDEDSGGFARCGFAADDDIDIAIEGGEEVHEALNGESLQAIIQQCGDFGLVDAQTASCGALGLLPALDDPIDGNGQADFGLFFVGAGQAEIAETLPELWRISDLGFRLGIAHLVIFRG